MDTWSLGVREPEKRPGVTVYLIRHGETEANRRGLILGGGDSPLTTEGIATAGRLAVLLAGRNIVRVFSSTLGRAKATAGSLAAALALPLECLPELAELSAGAAEGRLRAEVLPRGGLLRPGRDDRPWGGESYRDAEPRVAWATRRIVDRTRDGDVLVVGHAGVNRLVLACLLDRPVESLFEFTQPHELVLAVSADGSIFRNSPPPAK